MPYLYLLLVLLVAPSAWSATFRVDQNGFLDAQGRRMLLRGFNVAGNAKVPPFRHDLKDRDYERLRGWGVNVIRLLWIWEAFEPHQGKYQTEYLEYVRQQIKMAKNQDIQVIVDIHQDGFSRYLIGGCGDGFPKWVIPNELRSETPHNAERCQSWGARMAFDLKMHRAWQAFYANHHDVRDRFLEMLGKLGKELKNEPNLLGYDLLNEPWGTTHELKSLWEDSAKTLRAHDPTALIFVSPHALTSTGIAIAHQVPHISQAVYSPHYYDPIVIAAKHYLRGNLRPTLTRLKDEARAWGMPLFLGEFGFSPHVGRGQALRRDFYAALDHSFTSATQWNYTPSWNPEKKDGWNLEDFSVVNHEGSLRTNYKPRPYPQATAGEPVSFIVDEDAPLGSPWLSYEWIHDPLKGSTDIYVKDVNLFTWTTSDDMECIGKKEILSCSSHRPGLARLSLMVSTSWLR